VVCVTRGRSAVDKSWDRAQIDVISAAHDRGPSRQRRGEHQAPSAGTAGGAAAAFSPVPAPGHGRPSVRADGL